MRLALISAILLAATLTTPATAAPAPIVLTIQNHHFSPSQISAPAGQRFTIQVKNLDATPSEFESYDFKVEKIIVPRGTIIVSVSPLKPGTYKFFDDYHPDDAKGILTIVGGK